MVQKPSPDPQRELADFIRARRETLKPDTIGLPAGARRRTPGLRREEVAQLSGLSVTWYTWLEQGREVSVSPAALARLAAALQLGRAERAYLFELAGKCDPELGRNEPQGVSSAVLACVQAIACPAYILDHRWTARSWNAPARRLFIGWLDQPGECNLLRYVFLEPAARSLICDWEGRARRVAAEFRAAASAYLDDPMLSGLIAALREQSPEFAQFWLRHGVIGREGGERTFNHPADGFLRYEQVTFELAGQRDLKLTMLVPGTDSADAA